MATTLHEHATRPASPPMTPTTSSPWWDRPWVLMALVLLSAVPLLRPDVAPLVDLPGHMGRYHLQLELGASPALQRFYSFEWALIGNLGIDLLVMPLSGLFGLETAVKLIVLAIPTMTVAGFLLVAREAHGRVPPFALFAVPLAYNYPFMFGFVNFSLSMALAFLAFALWLRLGRLGRTRLRAGLFVPISLAIWITHAFGWGTLGVLAFAAEWVRQRGRNRAPLTAAWHAGLHAAALGLPFALMLLWRSGQVGGGTGDWFNFTVKFYWLVMLLRDRWMLFDLGGLLVLLVVLYLGVRGDFTRGAPALAIGAGLLALLFVAMPRIVFGSAYADMRLAPYMVAVAVLAIGVREGANRRGAQLIAVIALVFALVRTGATTISLSRHADGIRAEVAALDRLPRGARLVSFVGAGCLDLWSIARDAHLPAYALFRRDAFSNDQWIMAGAQLLRVDYPAGGRFVSDPSQMVTGASCQFDAWLTLDESLRRLPRDAFDYVWLIDPPRYDARLTRGMTPIWRNGTSLLLRIDR